jgi:hypothetical protein
VHSDNCKTLLFVFVVPAPQLRDNVLAVDSAVGPKFHHDNPALQVADRKRFTIKPRPTGNIRSRFPGSKGLAVGRPKTPRRQCNREKKPIDKAIAERFGLLLSTVSYTMATFPHLDEQSTAMGCKHSPHHLEQSIALKVPGMRVTSGNRGRWRPLNLFSFEISAGRFFSSRR